MKISDLVYEVLNTRDNTHLVIEVCQVSRANAEKILKSTQIDISDYTHVVDSFAIKHTLRKHGVLSEKLRGQIPVVPEDFDLIELVLTKFDTVEYAGKTKQGRNTLRYSKRINGHILYIEEVRSAKKKEAAMVTMYIKKA